VKKTRFPVIHRNRRIGDFLKELDLTEGRGTGFPKMTKKMENNGSPQPVIETDELGVYFMVTLPINQKYVEAINDNAGDIDSNAVNNLIFNSLDDIIAFGNGVSNGVSNTVKEIIQDEIHDKVKDILEILLVPTKRSDLFKSIALSNQSKNRTKYLDQIYITILSLLRGCLKSIFCVSLIFPLFFSMGHPKNKELFVPQEARNSVSSPCNFLQ
jgi:ATP-dependent DNA helicase RecG